jgi:hypothetical protein
MRNTLLDQEVDSLIKLLQGITLGHNIQKTKVEEVLQLALSIKLMLNVAKYEK